MRSVRILLSSFRMIFGVPGYRNFSSVKMDYGKSASDYGRHRYGLPTLFFEELKKKDIAIPGKRVLDVGTGTGDIARNLAIRGCKVTAIDPASAMLEEAKRLSSQLKISYRIGTAENTKQPSNTFDAVTAVQAYHWFGSERALSEITRVLKPDGHFVIASYDWKSPVGVSMLSQSIIWRYNPSWDPYSFDFYYKPHQDLIEKNFRDIQIVDFKKIERYTHADWVGRMSTTYGIGPSLSPEKVCEFKTELAQILRDKFPVEPLEIPHRCYIIIARRPTFFATKKSLAANEMNSHEASAHTIQP